MRSAGLAVALALVTAVASAQSPATIQVRAAGAVAQAGSLTLSASARLATLARAAAVRTDAYILGAAWLRPSLQSSQTRLKAGLLYDLGVMRREAAAGGQPAMAELATRLRAMVNAMPVTGRKVGATLEPHALQVTPQANLPLADGDVLYYPARPETVRVVGAVVKPCAVAHVGLRDARDYLAQCPPSALADGDRLYVIEPDGRVFEQGIAAWNASPPMPVAPGAVLYVPLSPGMLRLGASRSFDRDMADFIATQPLDNPDIGP